MAVVSGGQNLYLVDMDVSLEIVPRSPLSLKEDFLLCRAYPRINCVNIPDLTRFPLRSWEACDILSGGGVPDGGLIPHLRARDFSPEGPFPLKDFFLRRGIRRALVIAGDPAANPANPAEAEKASPTLPFIRMLKAELPELEIFAAFDPYRTNIRYELDYLAAKEEAGASGFMSQPFFDLRLLEIYAEYLEGKRVFWGVAPVLSPGNRNYWESRNRAVFPKSFRADLSWNTGFARRVADFCEKNGFHLYLAPIKVDLTTYLSGIFPADDR
ncbi:MAG: methylenetetrahydrofolate reductase [Treponema sp.]|jgi:methylenetetrahydrofolate reductase (NADPH)|nr:methylenetetrahydrofolate reductase [Treponema sp.]